MDCVLAWCIWKSSKQGLRQSSPYENFFYFIWLYKIILAHTGQELRWRAMVRSPSGKNCRTGPQPRAQR
jgi:hypothetical protein